MTTATRLMSNDFCTLYPVSGGLPQSDGKTSPSAGTLELTQVLQTTLDPDELISLLMRELQAHVPFDGLRYSNPARGIDLIKGEMTRHSATYKLTIQAHNLGEVGFFRSSRFGSGEIHRLENLLVALIYPLRNSLEYQRALHQALTDPLTGANNRGAMDMVLRREVELARRNNQPLSVILLDIDFFKQVNDTYGHSAGDLCLKSVAGCVRDSIRSSDLLFRCGGEEFLILLSQTELEGATLLAERIRHRVAELNLAVIGGAHLSVSLGATEMHNDDTAESLFERSDKALYKAKRTGRNKVEVLQNSVSTARESSAPGADVRLRMDGSALCFCAAV